MKKHIILLTISVICALSITAQNQNLSVSSLSGQSVESILQQHLAGDGVLITGCDCPNVFSDPAKFNNQTGNVTYPQIGTFNRNGFTTFPFETGLVMTTGNVSVAAGPNSSSGSTSTVSNPYSETQLSSLATSSINGSASLEFDFIAMTDEFAFNYIFGSEEYCEYVGSSYNDVFAFFLTGIDPVTYAVTTKNVAIIPGTVSTPVSINNVNSGNPCGSGGSNTTYYVNNPTGPGVEYDGYTTALAAQAVIFACQTYHMKLAVANVGDNSLDSGVFLEEGSFYSPHVQIDTVWELPHAGDTLIQNCRELDLKFSVERPALTSTTSIIINTGGNAVFGVDYTLTKPNGVEISPEDNSFYFPEGDTVQFAHVRILPTASFPAGVTTKTAELYIVTQGCTSFSDLEPHFRYIDTIILHLRANDTIVLVDTSFTKCNELEFMEVRQERGTPTLTYQWTPETGITDPTSLATGCHITESGTYQMIATDRWHCLADTATVEVTIVPKPEFTVTYTPDHGCMPLPVTLQTQYTPTYANLFWTISNDTAYNFTSTDATIHTTLPVPGYYDISLLVESAPGCSDSITYPNIIHVSDFPHADFVFSPAEPSNGEEVFFYNLSTGENITNYAWSFGDGHSSFVEEPSHTYHLTESDMMTVHLTVTNSDGCSNDTMQIVPVEDNFAFYTPNSFTPNNDGKNDIFLPKVRDVVNYEFLIYTRTGELIFATNNPEQGWDGNVKDKPAPEGVYVWKITYAKIGTPEEMMAKTGTITLLR
ncbi:MAG: choice-of-anchor L domain-containing protein [Bacteroidales bacterium]|nr:choice-of-anchor L domain-containing protein [Bacteroidales bacterium]